MNYTKINEQRFAYLPTKYKLSFYFRFYNTRGFCQAPYVSDQILKNRAEKLAHIRLVPV